MVLVINQLLYHRALSGAVCRCCKWLDDNEISSSGIPLFPGFAQSLRSFPHPGTPCRGGPCNKGRPKLMLLFLYAGHPYDSKLSTDSLHTKTG